MDRLVFHDKRSDVSSIVIHDYKEEANNMPTKLIVNLEEVYVNNKWRYSCFDYLLLSGRKKLTSKWAYSKNIHDNNIFKVARDAIDHSRRKMAKTPDKLIDEMCDGLTDEQKELVNYFVGKTLNERDKGE